ncbi:hypothetical protein BLL42_12590 [Pseudomonas frederiksbergensis]|uniref:Uncharacterized protein n=1 Tax=Pseudomonas frederiksbergensis TaxID=104087 RepID=A0A1J0EL01_9PSED|nr:hypothetical protein BLL42_12590 [Pseudomonas frederiksbergensis]
MIQGERRKTRDAIPWLMAFNGESKITKSPTQSGARVTAALFATPDKRVGNSTFRQLAEKTS